MPLRQSSTAGVGGNILRDHHFSRGHRKGNQGIKAVENQPPPFHLLVKRLCFRIPGNVGDRADFQIGVAVGPEQGFTDETELAAGERQHVIQHLLEGSMLVITGKKDVQGPLDRPVEVGNLDELMVFDRQVGSLEFVFYHRGQVAKDIEVQFPEIPRLIVDNADRADFETGWLAHRHAGIESNIGEAGHKGILRKAWIFRGVRHYKRLVLLDCVIAKSNGAGGLAGFEALAGFEPLPFAINYRKERGFHAIVLAGNPGEPFEPIFRGRIKDAQALKCCEPTLLQGTAVHGSDSPCLTRRLLGKKFNGFFNR